MRYLVAALGAAIVALAATSSTAATCPTVPDTYVDGAIDCFAPSDPADFGPGGNAPASLTDPFDDGADWTNVGKIDETTTSGTFGSLMVTLTFDDGSDFNSDSKSGTWTVTSGWPTDQRVSFAFKGSNDYLLYEMDTSGDTTGDWDTTGLFTGNNDSSAALSNFSVFVTEGGGEVPPIPLPATGLLVLGGLGVLASMRRRKRAA